MSIPPQHDKPKRKPFIREEIHGADQGCLRGLMVLIGLFLFFTLILYGMSQL